MPKSDARQPREGSRIAEWVLESPVGHGTFGDVWRARHHVWADQIAAVKLPRDPAYLQALRREGVMAHRLDHIGIVKAIGIDPFAETPYLVMEYVPGTTLRDLIGRGRMRPDDATAVLAQVLAALSHAHERGVVHRDVKPENVLIHEQALKAGGPGLAGDGLVKLTDFGLGAAEHAASGVATGGAGSLVFTTDNTATGSVAGSLDYMAPEQRTNANVDGRADVYACGVMLFEMLTGERPAGTDVPSDLVKNVPSHLDEAFRRSYARLDNRFASAGAFAAALIGSASAPSRAQVPEGLKQLAAGSCPSCGGRADPNDQFCMRCGKQLVEAICRCGKCGAFPAPGDAYCMFCGNGLSGSKAAATGGKA